MKNPYTKFQNPNMHGSEIMLCIKKHNGRTDAHMDPGTHKYPRSNMPSNFFEVGGMINKILMPTPYFL